jgi:hypothetical protein
MTATCQAVRLGDLARLVHLDIACRRCERRGRLRVARLIEQHGADIGMPDLAVLLAANCLQADATDPSARCFVIFPQLVSLTK